MSKTAVKTKNVKGSKNTKQSKTVRPNNELIGLRVLTNGTGAQRGRPAAREDRMTFNNGGLNFNDATRKRLNIPLSCYFQFLMNDASEKNGVFYATIHKDVVSSHSMKMRKTAVTYYRVMLPTAATEMKLLQSKDKVAFSCERISQGKQRSYVRISLIKK